MPELLPCPSCGTDNDADARFCEECGTPLSLACPSCGAEHLPGKRFCKVCGTGLDGAAAASPHPAPAPSRATVEASPSGEMRIVSVLFVDLVGYTSLSESRDAEDVRELLSHYFDTARTIVGRYGGVVEKFIGDAVMAVWGVPVSREDDAERAVRAGLELVDGVSALGAEVGAPQLSARAGVVTGKVAALANPGEGLVVGDRVNTASRVQSVAEPGSVFVDEITRRATSAAIAYADAGEHTVKGKTEPLRLWCASRVVAGIAGAQREAGLEAPFVGRDSELRLVKELFHAGVERRSARVVAVSGPAGVGKSRLQWEFEKYSDGLANDVLWHTGRCLSYGEGVAYWALAEMVRGRLGIVEEAPGPAVAAKLAAGLERWIVDPAERAYLTPRLSALVGGSEPSLGREELFAGWRLFFERLADHDPVVMVFEDLQWGDDGLLDFIEQLLDWSSQHSILILTFARPELAERREGWPAGRRGATQLYLEPLPDAAMGELLDGLVDALPPAARARIVAQAEGIPLYAIETVRALQDRGALVAANGHLALVGDVGELDVPATLSSLLAGRLDALEPEEREITKAMSVFGGSFPRAAVVALVGVPEDRVDAVLASLVRKEIFTIRADPRSPDRGQYAFAQILLRTVAHEMLSRRERKPRHLAAAEHLRSTFPDDGEEVAEVIAAHLLEAYHAAKGDPDAPELRARSLAALRRAAQRAAAVGAPEAAERSYRTAAGLADEESEATALTQAAGEMALQAGRREEALALFEAAAAAHLAAGRERDAARVGRHIGEALRFLGRHDEAVERMRQALEVLGPDRLDADVAELNGTLCRTLAFAGLNDEAAPPLETALRIAQALELHALLSQALTTKATVLLESSRPEEARVLYDGAIALAERHGDTAELLRALINSGNLHMQWDLPGALDRFEAAIAAARRLGDHGGVLMTTANILYVLILLGRWEEADRRSAEVLGDSDERGADAEYIDSVMLQLAIHRGDLAAARAALKRLSAWERTPDREQRASYGSFAAMLHLAEGDAERALATAIGLLPETMDFLGASHEAVRNVLPAAIDAALDLGRLDAAGEVLAMLTERPPGHVPPHVRSHLARGAGLVAAARGDDDAAERHLGDAVTALRALGYPYWLARAQTDLAAWLATQGRDAEAAALLDQALEALERLGAVPAAQRARELRDALPATVPA